MKVPQSSPLKKVTLFQDIFRLGINIQGVVQGVGFRPFVYQLATRHNLKGWVCNASEDVKIDIEHYEPAGRQCHAR